MWKCFPADKPIKNKEIELHSRFTMKKIIKSPKQNKHSLQSAFVHAELLLYKRNKRKIKFEISFACKNRLRIFIIIIIVSVAFLVSHFSVFFNTSCLLI